MNEIAALWSRIDGRKPSNAGASTLFRDFAKWRHMAAHDADPVIPLINIRGATRAVRLLALCLDGVVSAGLLKAVRGVPSTGGRGNALPVREVHRVGSDWKEYRPGSTQRAQHVHHDKATALTESASHAFPGGELVVLKEDGDPIDWRSPI